MKKALQVAMFSLFTVIGFNAQANEHHHETMSEAQPQVISATGVVKGIDLESKKITIHHDPIAAVQADGIAEISLGRMDIHHSLALSLVEYFIFTLLHCICK